MEETEELFEASHGPGKNLIHFHELQRNPPFRCFGTEMSAEGDNEDSSNSWHCILHKMRTKTLLHCRTVLVRCFVCHCRYSGQAQKSPHLRVCSFSLEFASIIECKWQGKYNKEAMLWNVKEERLITVILVGHATVVRKSEDFYFSDCYVQTKADKTRFSALLRVGVERGRDGTLAGEVVVLELGTDQSDWKGMSSLVNLKAFHSKYIRSLGLGAENESCITGTGRQRQKRTPPPQKNTSR